MNFNAMDEEVELMAPGPVEAIRQRFGPGVRLVIRGANEVCIPAQLRGASRKEFEVGPVEHVVAVQLSADSDNLAAVACHSEEQLTDC